MIGSDASRTQRWSVDHGRLVWQTQDAPLYPTAHEVWSLVFQEGRTVGGIDVDHSPEDALPDLRFSRFPADLVLLVSGDLNRGLRLDLAVRAGAEVVLLERLGDLTWSDQVIAASCWYPIDSAAIHNLIDVLRHDAIELGATISLGQLIRLRRHPDLSAEVIEHTELDPSAAGHQAAKDEDAVVGLHANLYPYQRDGVAFLRLVAKQRLGCILGDEMGLGKTLQVIALIQAETNAKRVPSLIIAPATLLENWRREFALFAPKLNVLVHAGANRPGQAAKLTPFDVVLTS
jgi:hypothetical protein